MKRIILILALWLSVSTFVWQAETPMVKAQQASASCVQAWTEILQNSTNVNAGVSALLGGSCNIQQQGYTVPTNPNVPSEAGYPFAAWSGQHMLLVVPPPFNHAILTPWGQLPPVDPSPGNWVVLSNSMDATNVPVLKNYATFLRFWAFSANTPGSCVQMSLQQYPGQPSALHCAALGDY